VAPLAMNAGTCWGKNTIGPRGRSVEKAPGNDFTFFTREFKKFRLPNWRYDELFKLTFLILLFLLS
jgi:hypothetical protein